MSDYGAEYTDKEIEKLERKIKKVYSQANKEIKQKANDFSARFKEQDSKKRALLKDGKITKQEYDTWKQNKIYQSDEWKQRQKDIQNILTNSNQKAMAIVNGSTDAVFATNANYAIYEIDQKTSIGTSFTLYDENTVSKLITENGDLLPKPKVDIPKDMQWNKNNMRNQVTQSIIQGESVQNLAKRLSNVTGKNQSFMMMHARTMMTCAQNAGRMQGFRDAKKIGINVYKKWLSAHDGHTRISHLYLDDEDPIPIEEPFEVGGQTIDYPGDPYAPPALVYNCRCTMTSEIMDEDGNPLFSFSEDDMDITDFEDWIEEHEWHMSEGKDISETWQRRNEEFDFEIEDVINAQGFDGTPRVVSEEEFKKAVEESSFIAQRTYSAPNQEVLDAYREQLYNGKWYVDCSTGGAQYGQGMYCAADYNGQLTKGIKDEMRHYRSLGEERNGFAFASIEQKKEYLEKWVKSNMPENLQKPAFDYIGLQNGLSDFDEANAGAKILGKDWIKKIYESGIGEDVFYLHNGYSYTETMTLDKSAKIVDYIDVKAERNTDLNNIRMSYAEDGVKAFAKNNELTVSEEGVYRSILSDTLRYGTPIHPGANTGIDEEVIQYFMEEARDRKLQIDYLLEKDDKYKTIRDMDIGAYATLKGYDAINAEGHGASGSYTVILNRTKVIIKGED